MTIFYSDLFSIIYDKYIIKMQRMMNTEAIVPTKKPLIMRKSDISQPQKMTNHTTN